MHRTPRGAHRDLRLYTLSLGRRVRREVVNTMIRERGVEGARAHLEAIIAIAAEARAAGLSDRLSDASMRLKTSGSVDAAVMRIRLHVERSHRRRQGVCIAVIAPGQSKEKRTNALAACGCPKCAGLIAVELTDYTTVIIRNAGPLLDRDEARSICADALTRAMHTYPCAGTFTKWYAKIAETDLRAAAREAIEWSQLARMDAPLFVGDPFAVSRYDRIADRTTDVFNIVAEREGVRHAIQSICAVRDTALGRYDAALAAA